jgi:hypothetical protein
VSKRVGGRFASEGEVPPCPFDGHRGSRVQAFGSRQRKDGRWVSRFRCLAEGQTHLFSECFEEDPPPVFAAAKCPQGHRGRVVRWGTNNKRGAMHQRYKCYPTDGSKAHTYTQPLPRKQVATDPNWTTSDLVRNPHRGDLASGRGHEFTMKVVAEGLQRLGQGESYASVGRWAAGQKPPRQRAQQPNKRSGKHFWQTGATWVELYGPVLWDHWQEAVAASDVRADASALPRVLVVDDVPIFGDDTGEDGKKKSAMLFSVLVAFEYFPSERDPRSYDGRVRLIRAFPRHNTDAYELLLYDCGFMPDVLISDSWHAIRTMVKHVRAFNPDLVWRPSAFHVVQQLRRAMAKLATAKPHAFVPGDLLVRMESMAFLANTQSWTQWWAELDRRMNAQAIPHTYRPNTWRKNYYDEMLNALAYAAIHPEVPKGTGALEANIRNEVGPFFAGRAHRFTNIERVNRACDLLTLRLNHQLHRTADIEKVLTAAALDGDGWMPAARQVNDPEGYRSLYREDVLHATLIEARKQARKRWSP